LSNPTYTTQQAEFITNFVGSDSELTVAFNHTFGTDISKSALRKKRQRMGVKKDAKSLRAQWVVLMGYDEEAIASLPEAVDPNEEAKQLAAASRLAKASGIMDPWT
jgi:hypothetical protein